MNRDDGSILNSASVLDGLTKTVLYEGYSIFPYHRTSVKNLKPIPFGVIYPEQYHSHNQHAPATMKTECIVTGQKHSSINITVRFLHLMTTKIFQNDDEENTSLPGDGWQTIERLINSGDLNISEIIGNKKVFPIDFDSIEEYKNIYDQNNVLKEKQSNSVLKITGNVIIEAFVVENIENTFRISVTVSNNTPLITAKSISRDKVFQQSFLSTNTILKVTGSEFVSDQNPPEEFKEIVGQCEKIGTWPILIDESNTIMLSSPIILYDYPTINKHSKLDLFDSLEIEEMLILQLSAMSDTEKQQIAESDGKMREMLDKASRVTPQELLNLHGHMFENKEFKI